MITPAYRYTIGSAVVDTTRDAQASTVVELVVSLDLDAAADTATLALGQVGTLAPARGDGATVSLGYADDAGSMTRVLTGTVDAVEPGLVHSHVTIVSGAALRRTRVERTFESQTAGAIIRALAADAGVTVATIDDGIAFPAYVVDGRRPVHRHMRDLAELSGLDLWTDHDGRLTCRRFTGGTTVHVLEHAKHVLALEIDRTTAFGGAVEAWGESPTGSAGDDAWGWLTPDFSGSRGTSGTGGRVLLERPALRTREGARAAAEALATVLQRRTLRGTVLTYGSPQIALGDAVRFRSLPDASMNTSFQVRRVVHRITKTGGFTTTVGFRSIAP